MRQEDICQVELYVKSRVVRDTILLASSGKIGGEETGFGSLERIHPTYEDDKLYGLMQQLRTIF